MEIFSDNIIRLRFLRVLNMIKLSVKILLMLLFTVTCLFAQSGSPLERPSEDYLKALAEKKWDDSPTTDFGYDFQPSGSGKNKSILKAVALSALLPGAGQLYLGHKYKALGFISAEILMIIGWNSYNNEGEKIENEFREYADTHWNEAAYREWKDNLPPGSTFSHTLPGAKNQQYYEMIGKYNQFLAGWPDTAGDPWESQMRLFYMMRQDDSNKNYKRAELLANLLLVNRVVSAAEAAISAKLKSSKIKGNIGFQPYYRTMEIIPVINLQYRR